MTDILRLRCAPGGAQLFPAGRPCCGGVPESRKLTAQMPFGGIAAPPAEKAGEDITQRVRVLR